MYAEAVQSIQLIILNGRKVLDPQDFHSGESKPLLHLQPALPAFMAIGLLLCPIDYKVPSIARMALTHPCIGSWPCVEAQPASSCGLNDQSVRGCGWSWLRLVPTV